MRVLFLDFDGVLNCRTSPDFSVDRVFVERLNRIIERTGAKVVISSTWRFDGVPYCLATLENAGFIGEVLGATPEFPGRPRGLEIQAWLDTNTVQAFVILDDDTDMEHLSPFLVRTRSADGLQEEDVERAVTVLGRCTEPT